MGSFTYYLIKGGGGLKYFCLKMHMFENGSGCLCLEMLIKCGGRAPKKLYLPGTVSMSCRVKSLEAMNHLNSHHIALIHGFYFLIVLTLSARQI